MNGNSSGFLEKFSWGAVIAGIATFLALFFGFPDYIFNLRPQIEKAIGTSTISFIEGAITASVVAIIDLKLLGSRGKESQQQERKKRTEKKAIDPPKSATDISIVKTPSLFGHDKLIEVYSPIHAMIVRINRKIPRETALQEGLIGKWVEASLIDFESIREVFNQHSDKLRERDFDMWLEIENELKERKEKNGKGNGFFLDKRRQEWFDELEAEYNRLKNTSWG